MGGQADIRSANENKSELLAAASTIILTLLLYSGCVALHFPDGPAQLFSTGAASLLLLTIRRRFVRRRSADRELREAIAGGLVVNPFLVCVTVAILILFVESFLGFVFGALYGATVAIISSEPVTMNGLGEVVPPFTLFFTVILTWPIAQYASHYLTNRTIPWLIGAVILSRILRLIIITSFAGFSWVYFIDITIDSVLLTLACLLGRHLARKRHRTFLLSRAFQKLSHSDQEAVLELLIDQRRSSPIQ